MRLRTEHLKCRGWGHAWDHELTLVVAGRRRMYELRLRCMRCETRRVDIVTVNTGEVTRRVYRYPDGYLVTQLDATWGGRVPFRRYVTKELVRVLAPHAAA